jgi:hypothetical protein
MRVKKHRERGRGANRREKQAAPESALIHPDHDIGRHMAYSLVHARPLGANHGLYTLQLKRRLLFSVILEAISDLVSQFLHHIHHAFPSCPPSPSSKLSHVSLLRCRVLTNVVAETLTLTLNLHPKKLRPLTVEPFPN